MVAVALAALVGAVAILTLIPGSALADNCSSLGDCWSTAAGAASAAVGSAFGALGGLFGGFGSGDDDVRGDGNGEGDDGDLPENEDLPPPRPC
ncbi:MAG: hypothetical protein ACT4OQ_13200 [Chloroflexota bacterium]